MSNSLKDAAQNIPLCLHELTASQKLSIALIREAARLELQYSDLKGALKIARKHRREPLRGPLVQIVTLASAIAALPRFSGVAYLGIAVDHDDVEDWIEQHEVGVVLSDCAFLSGSKRLDVALRYGGSMLIRLLSCSGALMGPILDNPEEEEIIFAPGERFMITAMQRRDFGTPYGRLWVINAEEMYWPSQKIPHWPDFDA